MDFKLLFSFWLFAFFLFFLLSKTLNFNFFKIGLTSLPAAFMF